MSTSNQFIKQRDLLFREQQIDFKSKYVTLRGPIRRVHYLELGRGQPLILLHGGGSNSCEWYNILQPLSKHFHLFVVDRPGCGLSDPIDYHGIDFQQSAVQFIKNFMDALSLNQASFLAQSMGGYFAISFAIQYPEYVDRLILIGAPAGLHFWIPLQLRLLGIRGINKILTKTLAKPSLTNVKSIHQQILVADPDHLADDYLHLVVLGQKLPGAQEGFLSLLENVLTISGWRKDLYIGDQLHLLEMPVYFIWGDQDAFEKPKTGQQKAASIKTHHFFIVENAGHCPWLDQPEECISLIEKCFKELAK
ncbi:MAG: alpha/beta hydrolase [Saprospiraceae bacterium]|nr:alpha/beta hydrolase [Saprospiraceae bacterium]